MVARRTAHAAAALTLVGSVALAGCSGATKTVATTAVTKPVTGAAAVDPAGISPTNLAKPPALKEGAKAQGARRDFTLDGQCGTKIGDQKVTGTIKSSAKTAMDYVVVVNWVNGSDVMGRAVKLVEKVEPGKTVKVELATKLTKAADGCTINVTRGTKA